MNTKINTFIFDCFGVICDPVLNGWYKEHRLKHGKVDENIQKIFRKFDLNIMSEDDILEYFLKYDGIKSDKEKLRAEVIILSLKGKFILHTLNLKIFLMK